MDINEQPLLIEVKMRYVHGVHGPEIFEETFLFVNDTTLNHAEIKALFSTVTARGDIIAPKYGLPQLAPVNSTDMTNENHHPYTSVISISGLEKIAEEHRLDDVSDLMLFSDVYSYLLKDTVCPGYKEFMKTHHTERADILLDELSMHFEELGIEVQDLITPLRKKLPAIPQ